MAESSKVTIEEIEARLRALGSGASESLGAAQPGIVSAGIVGATALLALSYLIGRRRGRRRATILEIHRG